MEGSIRRLGVLALWSSPSLVSPLEYRIDAHLKYLKLVFQGERAQNILHTPSNDKSRDHDFVLVTGRHDPGGRRFRTAIVNHSKS